MSASAPVLILGGTGNIASPLIHQLHSRGVPVIATVRDTAKAQSKLPSGTQLAQVDFNDPNTLQQAVQSSKPTKAFTVIDVINEECLKVLKAAGVTHIVHVSTAAMGLPTEPMALQTWQTGAEGAIKAFGFTWTILRPEIFMSNSFVWKQQIHSTGQVRVAYPDVAHRYIAYDDIAAVAATALTTQQYDNKTVTIQGPAAVSERQLLQAISQLLGKPIEVVTVSEDEYKKASYLPPPVVDSVHTVTRFRRDRGADFQAPTDAVVTGTTTYEQFVAQNKQAYAA